MQAQTQAGSVAPGIQKPPVANPSGVKPLSLDQLTGQSPIGRGPEYNDATQQQVSQPTPAPVVTTSANVQKPLEKQAPTVAKNTKGVVKNGTTQQQPQPQQQEQVVGDSSFIGPGPKKGLFQAKAEQKGMTKDGAVVDQKKINNFAIQRASDVIKNVSSRGEKVDEARLNEVFDATLSNIGIKAGTPQYMDAMKAIQGAYMENAKKSGFTSVEQSLNSLNTKYNELGKLKNLNSNDIYANYDNYTDEQKEYMKQNNPEAYAKAQAKKEQKQVTDELNSKVTGKKAVEEVQKVENKATSEFDKFIETPELKTAESMLTKYDDEIVKLQTALEPETMKKDIMSRYGTSLSTGALNALYYDESSDATNKLDSLLAQKANAKAEYDRIRQENLQRYQVVKQNEEQIVSSLMANGGLGLSSTSFKDIDQYVKDGYMTEGTAKSLKSQVNGMMDKTLQSMGKVTPQTKTKIQSMINSGMSPSSIFTNLINSGEYQAPIESDRQVYQNSDGSFTRIDKKSGTYQNIPAGSGVGNLSVVEKAQNIPDGPSNYNCATFVNATTGQAVGTTIGEKIAKINPNAGPTPGSIMVLSGTNKTYGHVAIVEGVTQDGKIQIREANYDGKGSVRSTLIDPANPGAAYGLKGQVRIEGYQTTGGGQSKNYSNTKGQTKLLGSEASNLATIGTIIPLINRMSTQIENKDYSSGPIMGNIGLIDPTASKTQGTQSLFQQGVKLIGGFLEGGKLAEGDQKKYEQMLPKVTDKPSVAKAKLDNIKQTVLDYYNGKLDELSSSYDVSGYSPKDTSIRGKQEQTDTTTGTKKGRIK